DHVRAALEGKSVTLPSPLAPESVTPNVTILQLRCSFCRKHSGEVRHLTVVRTIAVCSECLARYEIESRLDQCIEHLKAILDDPEMELGGTPDQISEQLNQIETLTGDLHRFIT